jgi:hypothetical protein
MSARVNYFDLAENTATWLDIGPTNKWAMFDKKIVTTTNSDDGFEVVINPSGNVSAIGFFGCSGISGIDISMKNSIGEVVYTNEIDMIDVSTIYDHYTYYLYQLVYKDEIALVDLPPIGGAEITLSFAGSNVAVGAIPMGFANNIGILHADGTSTDTTDYSTQEYDAFGELTYNEKPIVNINTYAAVVSKSVNPYIQRLIRNARGRNGLWIGDIGDGQQLLTYGRFERSPISYQYPKTIKYSFTVRGSI